MRKRIRWTWLRIRKMTIQKYMRRKINRSKRKQREYYRNINEENNYK
jgi:hypothetical protein